MPLTGLSALGRIIPGKECTGDRWLATLYHQQIETCGVAYPRKTLLWRLFDLANPLGAVFMGRNVFHRSPGGRTHYPSCVALLFAWPSLASECPLCFAQGSTGFDLDLYHRP